MAVSDQAIGHASAMGARAGEAWRTLGTPSRNPFDQERQTELAQAWRRAYFKAARI
jgi:hypothetical protein